jgi:NADH:ubiquinone oxidoreductase subunit E
MRESIDPLEILWSQILSREEQQIMKAFQQLDSFNKKKVLEHLKIMVEEEGWQPEQQRSAQAALHVLLSK